MTMRAPLLSLHVLWIAVSVASAQESPPAAPSGPSSRVQQQQQQQAQPATAPAADAKQGADAKQPAQAQPQAGAASTFSAEQLEQIAAPIALHPDALLAHIMMGATYPLEVVEAARWVEKNSKLTGKALEDALKSQDWDPAVKSLCGFPSVLKQMSDNLDWTQDLGDAFLGQKKELMDAVQRMRRKALDSGNLKSTEQQKVSEEGQVIIIQSASPEVIYVPTYSPTVVYGGWSYPYYYYPPMYAPYPPGAGFVAFSFGVAWGAAIWGDCNWGGSDVDIDIDHHNEFNRNVDRDPKRNEIQKGDRAGASNRAGTSDRGGNKSGFKHNPEHRKGVNYKSQDVANRMGASQGSSRVSRDQARGYDRGNAGASQRAGGSAPSARNTASSRPSSTSRPSTTPSRSSSTTRPSTSTRSSGSSALSGSRSSSVDRRASSRGASSRASSASRGGMSRGGGGGRRR
jgi:uncharacterized membrane protein YgcG